MFSRMDIRGLSEEYGSWKTICMLRRSRLCARRLDQDTSRPSNSTVPPSASSSPSRSRAVVDLPQPDSPTMPSVWPAAMLKLTPSTAETTPALQKPRRTLNPLRRSQTLKRGVFTHVGVDAMVVMGWASPGHSSYALLISSASLMASLSRLNAMAAAKMNRPGIATTHGCTYRDPRSELSI